MTFTIPMQLTLLRIVMIPLFVVVFYLPVSWAYPASAWLFTLAGITDWLDGYLARRLEQTSAFGAFLDPVADKLMVATALVMLVDAHGEANLWLSIPAMIIIGREITVSALREWMAELGQSGTVAVSYLGKVKTTVQIVSILLLLYYFPIGPLPTFTLGLVLVNVAALLTLWSMLGYLRAAYHSVRHGPKV